MLITWVYGPLRDQSLAEPALPSLDLERKCINREGLHHIGTLKILNERGWLLMGVDRDHSLHTIITALYLYSLLGMTPHRAHYIGRLVNVLRVLYLRPLEAISDVALLLWYLGSPTFLSRLSSVIKNLLSSCSLYFPWGLLLGILISSFVVLEEIKRTVR